MPHLEGTKTVDGSSTSAQRALPSIRTNWDSTKVYKQLVILIEYKQDSVKFLREDARGAYNKIFNQKGYNERAGKGCVADYFREQSGGLTNLQFDVYGPYEVDYKAQPYSNPSSNTRNQNTNILKAAVKMFLQENPTIEFSQYDWNNDDYIEQVIFVHAGYTGNVGSDNVLGYHWPNTSSFSAITTPDGKKISNYSSSAELWPNNSSCGIGTICHEYSHSLGLPDIYPVPSWTYTAVDEWDLMDGGNFTNYGWCPPNYSPLEKMLLGWAKPIELTEPFTVQNLKAVSEGGGFYQIKHTDTEYLLLENRKYSGWDFGVPGQGLLIYHVNYIPSYWSGNRVNGDQGKPFNYSLIYADNRDYDAWDVMLDIMGARSEYQNKGHMNKYHLSGSPYPYVTDTTEIINALTDTSVPAAEMIHPNSEGSYFLSKPITNIQMKADGTVTFDFMGGTIPSGVQMIENRVQGVENRIYDLSGRRSQHVHRSGFYIVRRSDGTVKKVFK